MAKRNNTTSNPATQPTAPVAPTVQVPVLNPASAPQAQAGLATLYVAGTMYKGGNATRQDFCKAMAALQAPVTGAALLALPAAQAVLANRALRYKAHKAPLAQVGFFVSKGWVKPA